MTTSMPPTLLDDITRGDERTIELTDLRDEDLNPAAFQLGDVLRWTAKRHANDTTFLFDKSTGGNGITFTAGTSAAEIALAPADYPASVPRRLVYHWDLQYLPGGDTSKARTIAYGSGAITRDITP